MKNQLSFSKQFISRQTFLYANEYEANREKIAQLIRDGIIEVTVDYNRSPYSDERNSVIYRIKRIIKKR